MVFKMAIPGMFQFKMVQSRRFDFREKEGDIHYIGGADILPPPQRVQMRGYCS